MTKFPSRLYEACVDESNPHIKFVDGNRVSVDFEALLTDEQKHFKQVCPRAASVSALLKQLYKYGFEKDQSGCWKHSMFTEGANTYKEMHTEPLTKKQRREAPAPAGSGGKQQQQQQQPGDDSSTGALAEVKAQQQLHRERIDALGAAAASDRTQHTEMVKALQQEMHERDEEHVRRQQQLSNELAAVQHSIVAEQQARAADVREQRLYIDQSRLQCINMVANVRTELRSEMTEQRKSFISATSMLMLEGSQAAQGGGSSSSSTCAAAARTVAV
jgi:hypothetical protein